MREMTFHSADELSHAYILLSPSAEERKAAATALASAAVCSAPGPVPCGVCRACRKVRAGIHPDVITISRIADDKGKKKREISVDQIRNVIADSVVLPNEAERKVYVIDEADTMNIPAQNAALKLLEEPPRGVIFLLLASNAEHLLETVRSRCAEIVCGAQEEEPDAETVKLGMAFLKRCAEKDEAQLNVILFEVPAIVKYTLESNDITIGAGVNLGIKLMGSSNFDQTISTSTNTDHVSSKDDPLPTAGVELSGIVEFGYLVNRNFVVDLRLLQRFTNLLYNDVVEVSEIDLKKAALYGFHVTVGFSLYL